MHLIEAALRAKVKAGGGIWNRKRQAWTLPYATAAELRRDARILEENSYVQQRD